MKDNRSREEILMENQELRGLLKKFGNHSEDCGCFICRNLSGNEKEALNEFWNYEGGRKQTQHKKG